MRPGKVSMKQSWNGGGKEGLYLMCGAFFICSALCTPGLGCVGAGGLSISARMLMEFHIKLSGDMGHHVVS